MVEPCESSTPKTSAPVSVCVSKWIRPIGPRRVAIARMSGSAIEWSPPRMIGSAPRVEHLPDDPLDRLVRAHRVGGQHGSVAEVDDLQDLHAVDARLQVRSVRDSPRGSRAGRSACPAGRTRGRRSARPRSRRRRRPARRVLRVGHAGEREQPRVVGLLTVFAPALERIDHRRDDTPDAQRTSRTVRVSDLVLPAASAMVIVTVGANLLVAAQGASGRGRRLRG